MGFHGWKEDDFGSHPPADGVSYDWFDDEILRDIRINQNKFELLPFSAWFRNSDTDSKIG